jgi:transposase-like protein
VKCCGVETSLTTVAGSKIRIVHTVLVQFVRSSIVWHFDEQKAVTMVRFLGLDEPFEGRHFDREIIVLRVRWYSCLKLSFRDLEEMMTERGRSLVLTTIMGKVHHYAPEFERRWNRFARPSGSWCRVDERYVKIGGKWVYRYRTVDRDGRTVDFRLGARCDVGAVKPYLRKAIKSQGTAPRTITLDGYAASHRAVREMKADGQLLATTKL